MVRRIAIIVAALMLASVVGAGVWLHWVFKTPQGFLWALQTVSRLTPVQIGAQEIDGGLGDENIGLKTLQVKWPGGEATVDSLSLRWNPVSLIRGRISVDSLCLDKITAKAQAAGKTDSSGFSWPRVSGLALFLNASIQELKVSEFRFEATGQPVQIDECSSRLSWKNGVLSVDDLVLRMPEIQVSGKGVAGFVESKLEFDGKAMPARPVAGFEALLIQARIKAGKRTRAFPGSLDLTAVAGNVPKMKASIQLSLLRNGIDVSEALIIRPDQPGILKIQGKIDWAESFFLDMQADIRDLNLFPETGVVTALNGSIQVQGAPGAYHGHFALQNQVGNWQRAEAAADFTGNLEQIVLTELKGLWLDGTLMGSLSADWSGEKRIETVLKGRHLDPSKASSQWTGRVNLDLSGHLTLPESGPVRTGIQAELLESVFMGKTLTGALVAKTDGLMVDITRLDLAGKGFRVNGAGKLHERLNLSVDLDDLGLWVPEARGKVRANGWIRRLDQQIGGELQARGEVLSFQGLSIDSLLLSARHVDPKGVFMMQADAGNIAFQGHRLESCGIRLEGLPEAHRGDVDFRWPTGEARLKAEGGFLNNAWSGRMNDLALHDDGFGAWTLADSVKIRVSSKTVAVSPARFWSPEKETAVLGGEYSRLSGQGFLDLKWRDLNLSRLNLVAKPIALTGKSSGNFHGALESEGGPNLEGALEASGTLRDEKLPSTGFSTSARIRWDEKGLSAETRTRLEKGGEVVAGLRGPALDGFQIPEQVRLDVSWKDIDSSLARPWLPESLDVEGRLSGGISGTWFSNHALDFSGHAALDDGRILITGPDAGLISAQLQTARVNWQWRTDHMSGDLLLTLADYGQVRGRFQIPVAARRPLRLAADLPIEAKLSCQMKEQGLLSAIFPGMIQETQGDLSLDVNINGTFKDPKLSGALELARVGGYFPTAGIHIQNAGLKGRFSKERLVIESLVLPSGKGRLKGDGEVRLDHWRVSEYQIHITGENFQAVDLAELQLQVNPDLQVRGTGKKVKIEGEVTLTDALASERRTQAPVTVSEDALIIDGVRLPEKQMPVDIEARVRVIFGDHVLVKAAGVDARLAGNATVMIQGVNDISARGEISVAKGAYAAYGVKLNIERGKVIFAGGPMDHAALDILALKTVGDIQAGVRVTGTVRKPVVKLHSQPAMADTDILAYMVLGHPVGEGGGQINLLMMAAGALLSKGESAALQDRLQKRLGVDVIEIQAGSGDASASMVTIGKYLSPKLFVSLGHALFTGANEFRMRYGISESWDVESNFGEQSGADLFYKIEFK